MLPLEEALFVIPLKDRTSTMVARHYGLDGRGGANFQCIGTEFGLTRERVRQIVSKAGPCCQILPEGGPFLDRVIAFIAASLPAPAEEIETKLRLQGLTRLAFRIEGIVNVATLMGRPVPFRIGTLSGKRFVLPIAGPSFSHVVGRSRRKVRRDGMAMIADFMSDSQSRKTPQVQANLIETILASQPDFRWLDRRAGWFWLGGRRSNSAVRRIRKMLSVANPLDVRELRCGLERGTSRIAPASALLELCRQIEGLSVCGNLIHAIPPVRKDKVLNKTERDVFLLLSKNNGRMSNTELFWRARSLGIKRPTFYQCVTCSPVVVRYKGSHYRLIGTRRTSDECVSRSGTGNVVNRPTPSTL
jgi:hypothetical protein